MNIDQILSEYVIKSNIFYRETETKQQFDQQYLYNSGLNRFNIKEILNKYQDNDIIKFQNLAIPQIQKALLKMEDILIEDINLSISKINIFTYTLILVGLIVLLFSIYFANSIIGKILNNARELVNVIFILYLDSNTPIPDFKENN